MILKSLAKNRFNFQIINHLTWSDFTPTQFTIRILRGMLKGLAFALGWGGKHKI